MQKTASNGITVKLYHGFGHQHDLFVYGHLLEGKLPSRRKRNSSFISNVGYLVKLFLLRAVGCAPLELNWRGQLVRGNSADDGFIRFEWNALKPVEAGWHEVTVSYRGEAETTTAIGQLFVPHITQYAYISDIDDTIMVSHSGTIFRRLRELFTRHPHNRKIFEGVRKHYQLLAASNTTPDAPNPFFYVSSSEWNLYDYLDEFFQFNELPKGVFLLNHLKRWNELLRTGKTKHQGKLLRITRIIQALPRQQFVLLGDNSQEDPQIYRAIAEKYPGRVYAIYIRNADEGNEAATRQILKQLQQRTGIHTCLFSDSAEAINHSVSVGLVHF